MQRFIVILISLFFVLPKSFGQNDKVNMIVILDKENDVLKIEQDLTYYNTSKDTLQELLLHDWANAYSDKNTALGKRFIENYSNKFFFTSEKNRGHTSINNIVVNYQSTEWIRKKDTDDYFKIPLEHELLPNDSVSIKLNYSVKIPNSKFTHYGVKKGVYNLKYWYIIPVVYDKDWQLMHNLNMDDLYQSPTDFDITLKLPSGYRVVSNLEESSIKNSSNYQLKGKNIQDIKLLLTPHHEFINFNTDDILVSSNLNNIDLNKSVKKDILNRQLLFLKEKLGNFPHHKILITETDYNKNPLYGMNQLPSFLRPFSDTFEWDMRMFKTLSNTYISNSLQTNTRENAWLQEGLQAYLMMQYVEEYYKDVKFIGKLSKIWGIRTYQIAKLNFNDRYNFAYQYIASKNRDQALSTATDSLTNFNRLILNRYKTGLALHYLDNYLENNLVQKAIKVFFEKCSQEKNSTKVFKDYITSHTTKDTDWFFNDVLYSDKKVDYKLRKLHSISDSIVFTIKNKKSLSVPVALYGITNDSIISKTWISKIDSTTTIKLKNNNSTRWVLNYKEKLPEINLHNNWQKAKRTLFRRPLKLKWLKDADDPYHNQLFIEPQVNYNYYDGAMLASAFSNRGLQKKTFEYKITPSYGFKSKTITGSFKTMYLHFLENSKFDSYKIGLSGSYFHYTKDLIYKKLTPYIQITFKPKNLRSVVHKAIHLNYTMVNREVKDNFTEADQYNVLNLNYTYSNPELINNFLFSSDIELGSQFSKLSTDIRFRKLTNSNRQFEVRFFAGAFLHNNTSSDFFSFGVNRPNDYLFRYGYYGAAETKGFFSQEIIINDGGFKADISIPYANQWISSLSTSVGLWRWFEIYNDVGFAKNRNKPVYFIHDKGFRLNFVHNIFEVYLPIHSNNGWEISEPHYEEKIRFVFTTNFKSIYSLMKRGFM